MAYVADMQPSLTFASDRRGGSGIPRTPFSRLSYN